MTLVPVLVFLCFVYFVIFYGFELTNPYLCRFALHDYETMYMIIINNVIKIDYLDVNSKFIVVSSLYPIENVLYGKKSDCPFERRRDGLEYYVRLIK